MQIFDSEELFVQRPHLYHIAKDGRNRMLRARVDEMLDELYRRDEDREKIISRLRNGLGFFETLNRLSLGYLLNRSGFDIREEERGPAFGWDAWRDELRFIADIYTLNPGESFTGLLKKWEIFCDHMELKRIAGDPVRILARNMLQPPEFKFHRSVRVLLEDWAGKKPQSGDTLEIFFHREKGEWLKRTELNQESAPAMRFGFDPHVCCQLSVPGSPPISFLPDENLLLNELKEGLEICHGAWKPDKPYILVMATNLYQMPGRQEMEKLLSEVWPLSEDRYGDVSGVALLHGVAGDSSLELFNNPHAGRPVEGLEI